MDQYDDWVAKMMNQENRSRRTHHKRHKHHQCQFFSNPDNQPSQRNNEPMHSRCKIKKRRKIKKDDVCGLFGPFGPFGVFGPFGPYARSCAEPAGAIEPAGVLGFADFFALMPPDNVEFIAPGTDVSFPQDGPANGSAITRTSSSTFDLSCIGIYQVHFQVSVAEAGQLVLTLNGADLAYTVAGRAAGGSQIVGIALLSTVVEHSILTVRNPAGNATALTMTPFAGGTYPVSAHLAIMRIA